MRKIVLISCVLALSCTPAAKITTTNLQDLAAFEPNSNIYALPQTRVLVTISAIRKSFTPGPYYQYAKRFLGIENVHSEPFESWEIEDVKLNTFSEPDPDCFFSVKQEGCDLIEQRLLKMTKDGLVVAPSSQVSYQLVDNESIRPVQESLFTDVTIKPYFYDPSKKKQKNLLADSAYSKIPSLKKQLEPKKIEEKANEAANFILKIRKRRFKLLAGQYEVFPEGIALKTSIEELNKLEAEYLSLFIGKMDIDTITRNAAILPASGEKLQRFTAFGFSGKSGFYASTEEQGNQIVVEIEDLNSNEILNQMGVNSSTKTYPNMLIYRIPDKALVKIVYGSYIILESEISVYQFGALVPMQIPARKRSF